MRYLVIGDAGSMHIYNFVKTVLMPRGYEVHLLTLSADPVRENYRKFYSENGIIVHSIAEKGYKNLNKKDKFHRLLNVFRKLRLMKELPCVDICHVQSVYKTACLMVLRNRKKFKKLIMSYWGGDIEDRARAVVRIRKKCFDIADAITVTVQETYDEFRRIYGEVYDKKLRISRFATDGIGCIKKLSTEKSREECRELYGIPKGKICVTCGYSAYASQHQDWCLIIISRLPEEIRKKIYVIVPLQYGRYDKEYLEKVRGLAKNCGAECSLLEEFVPFEVSAQLAIATDIYLHLRSTDAFSNALKEHVFASSYVIKGDWLKYPELEEMKAQVESIPSFRVLGERLVKAISEVEISNEIKLFEPIYQMYSPDAVKNQWCAVIDSVINKDEEV